MFGLSTSQITAVAERLLYIVVPMLTANGLAQKEDEQLIVSFALAILAFVIGIMNNRAKRLADRAAQLPDTVVITTPEIAKQSRSLNVVSNDQIKAEPK